ncbi:MAG: hypothetical protein ACI84K_000927 [Pseudohongiellaceae bacterium]|jgi:hypothetical protein
MMSLSTFPVFKRLSAVSFGFLLKEVRIED